MKDGKINMNFFAPDCFHFSQWGHGIVSTWLWKNILEPANKKTTKGDLTNPAIPLACPDPDGKINMNFFAPDCFHFSQWGHGIVSTWLWKNILEPANKKTTKGDLTNPAIPLACPDPKCPFIRTNLNSKDCSKYMTPTK
ncbi:hypothetical protein COOONC_05680 [Cooperia oncophora]